MPTQTAANSKPQRNPNQNPQSPVSRRWHSVAESCANVKEEVKDSGMRSVMIGSGQVKLGHREGHTRSSVEIASCRYEISGIMDEATSTG